MRVESVKRDGKYVQTVPLAERFWMKVERLGSEECWTWLANSNHMPGTLGDPSYGRFKLNGKNELAHRMAWVLTFGAIPDGLWVLHRCDNHRCVNPSHLFLGTRSDNIRDCIAKGRMDGARKLSSLAMGGSQNPACRYPERLERGTQRHQAKLDERTVREIRRRHKYGKETYIALGRRFGVNEGTIRAVVSGRTWKHVG